MIVVYYVYKNGNVVLFSEKGQNIFWYLGMEPDTALGEPGGPSMDLWMVPGTFDDEGNSILV